MTLRKPTCQVPVRDVQRVFDGELREAGLLAHIEQCDACSGRLARMRSRRDALAVLGGARTGSQRVLLSTGRAARVALADGLAGLIDALVADATGAATGGATAALDDLRALVTRLSEEGEPTAGALLARLPSGWPAPERTRDVARDLLALLADIEGRSPRVLQWHTDLG